MSEEMPWDRREDETSRSFQAFCIYRDLGPGRSLPKAWAIYREVGGLKAVDPTGTFKDWCSQNDWVARCTAWDDHEERLRRESRIQAREDARQAFVDQATRLANQLMKVALGSEEAGKDQVKAIIQALDRAGVTVPKEMVLEHTGPGGGPVQVGKGVLESLADMSTEEKASAYKDLIGDDQEP